MVGSSAILTVCLAVGRLSAFMGVALCTSLSDIDSAIGVRG